MVVSDEPHSRLLDGGGGTVGRIKRRSNSGRDGHPRVLIGAHIADHIFLTRRLQYIEQWCDNRLKCAVNTAHLIGTHRCPIIMREFIAHSAEVGLGRGISLRSIGVNHRLSVIHLATRVFEILRSIHGRTAIRRCRRTEILARGRLAVALAVQFNRTQGFTLLHTGCRKPTVRRIHEECIGQMFLHSA